MKTIAMTLLAAALVAADLTMVEPDTIETAENHPEVDRLMERLERQSDDGTLNSDDMRRIRMLRKRLAS